MPFKAPNSVSVAITPASPALAAAVRKLEGSISIRDYSSVSVLSVGLSAGEKEMYLSLPSAPEELVKTWSFTLSTAARYEGCGEEMQISGGGLKRTLHEFMWLRAALIAEYPGMIVPPITAEAAAGDAGILERFVSRCLEHPILREAVVLKCFVLSPPSEFASAQRDFVADGAPPPLHVQMNALFLKVTGTPAEEFPAEDVRGAAMSTDDVRAALRWTRDQLRSTEKTMTACTAAAAADAKALGLRLAAAAKVIEKPVQQQAGVSSFGPAKALPYLRDMVGFLHALEEAISGREKVRRSLHAATDNLTKHASSNEKRLERVKSAERHSQTAKDLREDKSEEAAKKAKNMISALSFKAASGVAKTAAALGSAQSDVDKARDLVTRLKAKYADVNARLEKGLVSLQAEWPAKQAEAYLAYLQGEQARLDFDKAHLATLSPPPPEE